MKQGSKILLGLGVAGAGLAAGAAMYQRQKRVARQGAIRTHTSSADGNTRRRIVIMGAGFGGFTAAARLIREIPTDAGWEIVLIDRQNYHLFTPLLYHAASGLVDPTHILFPVRDLPHAPHFTVRESEVQSIDLERRVLVLDDGELEYHTLILSPGSVTNYFGMGAEIQEHTLPLKGVSDALRIRNRVIDRFEEAAICTDPEEQRRILTFVVVGGGATGVELLGSLHGLMQTVLPRLYPDVPSDRVRLILAEAMPRILPGISERLVDIAVRDFEERGIEVRLNTAVTRVTADYLETKTGEQIPTRTVIWAAGVKPSPLLEPLQVEKVRNGRIVVDEFLEVPGHPGLYVLGDGAASTNPKTGQPLPPSAAVAVQEGEAAARIVTARLAGQQPEPFQYQHRGELISLGRHAAVAELFGKQLTGFPAWLVWRGFYLSQLTGFKNRLGVAFDWSFAYLYDRSVVRLPSSDEPRLPAASSTPTRSRSTTRKTAKPAAAPVADA